MVVEDTNLVEGKILLKIPSREKIKREIPTATTRRRNAARTLLN